MKAGATVVPGDRITGYPLTGGSLTHGKVIGTWKSVARWAVNSWTGSHMHQIEAIVNGVTYTGRGLGEDMLFTGKRKAGK